MRILIGPCFGRRLRQEAEQKADSQEWLSHKIIVEHTSNQSNKRRTIGHVRNAVLGDTMVRILRTRGTGVADPKTTLTIRACKWRTW